MEKLVFSNKQLWLFIISLILLDNKTSSNVDTKKYKEWKHKINFVIKTYGSLNWQVKFQ